MKTFIIALATTSALALAVPAGAQTAGANIDLRVDRLQGQLQAGVQSGAITRAEAMPLRQQLRQLSALERQYARGGFTMQERSDLRSRMISLRQGIRIASQNGDDRFDRDDRDRYDRDCPPGLARKDNGCMPPGQVGRDDRDGRWGDSERRGTAEWIDRNRDGYDDRDLNRDRRIDDREWRMAGDRYDDRYDRNGGRYDRDDDRYDRDGDRYGRDDDRYEDRGTARGGIGGLIDTILGGGTLRVGQRVSGNLGAVPYEYRSQYRDGNGVYYRSDGRSIYQVDARTDTVLRIYSMRR